MKWVWMVGAIAATGILLWILWPPATGTANSGLPCLQNLKNIYGSVAVYSEDADQRLPPPDSWSDALGSYAKSKEAFHCPAVEAFGYAWNSSLGPKKTNEITSPASTSLVFDSSMIKKNAVDSPANLPDPPRHGGKNQVLFADGHGGAAN